MSNYARVCGVCSGRGRTQCSMCGGAGSRTQTAYYDGSPYAENVSCGSCSGGYRFCECCSGTGKVYASGSSSGSELEYDDEVDAPADPPSTAELSSLYDEAVKDAFRAQQELLQELKKSRPRVLDLARYNALVRWVHEIDPLAPGTAKTLAGMTREFEKEREVDLEISCRLFESACSRIETYGFLKGNTAGR